MTIRELQLQEFEQLKYKDVDHKRAVMMQVMAQKINEIIRKINKKDLWGDIL